jgi:chemotaxis response regulator CheB
MIVDDSAVVRQVLTALLNRERSIEVVGAAPTRSSPWSG